MTNRWKAYNSNKPAEFFDELMTASGRPRLAAGQAVKMLQSLSAMGTYRRRIGPLVEAVAVVDFVFRERTLPRSVRFCLDGIREELAPLKNHREALRIVERFQLELNALGDSIALTWFLPTRR